MSTLTPKFMAGYIWTQIQTTVHKFWVGMYLMRYDWRLIGRALRHDLSKYRWSEAQGFAQTIFELKHTRYGTPEYQALLDRIRPSLTLHYARNTHHPEHWANGYEGMSHDDIIELVADWSAAVRRTKDGNLERSITQNAGRFGYSEQEAGRLRMIAQQMRSLDG